MIRKNNPLLFIMEKTSLALLFIIIIVIGLQLFNYWMIRSNIFKTFQAEEFAVIGWDENKSLWYNFKEKDSYTLISSIERYYAEMDKMYLVGYYSSLDVNPKDNKIPYSPFDPENKNKITFEGIDNVPRYVILNFKTKHVELYKKLKDVPDTDKIQFTRTLDKDCLQRRDCYIRD